MTETWSGVQTVLGNSSDIFNVGIPIGTTDTVEFDGRIILKGNNGSTQVESLGMTIEYTGTLISLFGGFQILGDLTITDVSGTVLTYGGGSTTATGVDLNSVRLTYEDFLSDQNVLRLKIINGIQDVNNDYYNLQYKYFTRIRYFNTL